MLLEGISFLRKYNCFLSLPEINCTHFSKGWNVFLLCYVMTNMQLILKFFWFLKIPLLKTLWVNAYRIHTWCANISIYVFGYATANHTCMHTYAQTQERTHTLGFFKALEVS